MCAWRRGRVKSVNNSFTGIGTVGQCHTEGAILSVLCILYSGINMSLV